MNKFAHCIQNTLLLEYYTRRMTLQFTCYHSQIATLMLYHRFLLWMSHCAFANGVFKIILA